MVHVDGNTLTLAQVCAVARARTADVRARSGGSRAHGGIARAHRPPRRGRRADLRGQHRSRIAGQCAHPARGSRSTAAQRDPLALRSGVGEPLARDAVRAMMLIRANVLAKGFSGIRPLVAERLCDLVNRGVTPVVPSQGSVGAIGRSRAAGAHGAGVDRRRGGGIRGRGSARRGGAANAPGIEAIALHPRKASA